MNVLSLKCSVLYHLLQILPQQVKQFLQKGHMPLVKQLALTSEVLLVFKVEMNEAIHSSHKAIFISSLGRTRQTALHLFAFRGFLYNRARNLQHSFKNNFTFSVNTVTHRELHISILVQASHNMWFLWHFPGSTACQSSMTMKCYPHWKEVVELFIVGFR